MQRLWNIPHDNHPALLQMCHHWQSEASGLVQTLAPWPGLVVLPECVSDSFCQPLVIDGVHEQMLSAEHRANNVAGGRAS